MTGSAQLCESRVDADAGLPNRTLRSNDVRRNRQIMDSDRIPLSKVERVSGGSSVTVHCQDSLHGRYAPNLGICGPFSRFCRRITLTFPGEIDTAYLQFTSLAGPETGMVALGGETPVVR